jgi:putative flippase GtrA
MAKWVAPNEVEDLGTMEPLEPVTPSAPVWGRGTTQPMPAVPVMPAIAATPATSGVYAGRRMPSYHPTQWPQVNRALDIADRLSGGRADWVQRFVTYSFIGGCAAVVNLFIFAIMWQVVPLPLDTQIWWQDGLKWFIAFAVSAEISIFANFIPNDYFTFRHLPGHKRTWVARAARFNLTCMAGTLLTLVIAGALHFVHVQATLGQAIAIALVFLFNFTFHHIYTYRHKGAPAG